MALPKNQLPKANPPTDGYRSQPGSRTPPAPTTNQRLRTPDGAAQPRKRAAPSAVQVPPYVSQLTTDLDFLEQAAATKLAKLAKPTKRLLSTLRAASSTISRNHSTLHSQLRSRTRQSADAVAALVKSEQASRPAMGAADAHLTQQGIEARVQAEAVAKLAESLTLSQADFASKTAASILTAANELEDELARLKLDSLGISDASKMDLEELLRAQHVVSELESRPCAELLSYWTQLLRLKPDEARALEAPLLKVAKARADLGPARARARVSSSQQAVEQDRLAALRLVGRIETARELRTGPELQTFETEFRPHLGALIRRTIGTEVADLDRFAFEKFAKNFRPGARLGDITPRFGWPLRSALHELPPAVRKQVPAKFFSPVE